MAERSLLRPPSGAPGDAPVQTVLEAHEGRPGGPSLDLDRVIHERVRLAIVSALATAPSLSFTELRRIVGATDGNLSVHARKLEQAGYVRCRKSFSGRIPRTDYALTERGRRALERYIGHMEDLIRMMKGNEP